MKSCPDEHNEYAYYLFEELCKEQWPAYVKLVLEQECRDLESSWGNEAGRIKKYLDWVTSMPWTEENLPELDLQRARFTLDAKHYGMEEVKQSIVEFLAVQDLTNGSYGTVLLLVGAPGVGKTSIAQSIAVAMGRKFTKVSLGGMYDESLLRGCDRSYSSSQPGRIVRALRQCGSLNPVMLLDEIDKIGRVSNFGDVSAALLEILDSDRTAFIDNYLNIPLDLSRILFIATANNVEDIPSVLLDRMFTVELNGYSAAEKTTIARDYILPEECQRHGLNPSFIRLEEDALQTLIQDYTCEPGVRSLQRHIQSMCRRIAYYLVSGIEKVNFSIDKKQVEQIVGQPQRPVSYSTKMPEVGVVNALGCSKNGQKAVIPVEVAVVPGTGKIKYTGNLRTLIQESCEVAVSLVKSRLGEAYPDILNDRTMIHFHALNAGVPKEGPSMGATLVTGLISALTQIPVHHDLAITGEVSLHGRILPVGSIEEKLLAAYQGGMKSVVIPEGNREDLLRLPEYLHKNLRILIVKDLDELLEIALLYPPAGKLKSSSEGIQKRYKKETSADRTSA